MESILFVLGVAGCYLLVKGTQKETTVQKKGEISKERLVPANLRADSVLLLLLFVVTASFAWWTTDVLYDQQVIYSDYAPSLRLAK